MERFFYTHHTVFAHYLFSFLLFKIQIAQVPAQLHQPGNTQVYDEATEKAAGVVNNDAQNSPAEKGTDAFAQRFTKMKVEIKKRHR